MIGEAVGGGGGVALHVLRPSSTKIMVYLYSPEAVRDNLAAVVDSVGQGRDGGTVPGVIVGVAGYGKPEDPCHGAWAVTSVAGVGYGRILYGLGYNLTPRRRLMPDRFDNTQSAIAAWRGAAGKRLRGLPLDDVDDPRGDDPEAACQLVRPRRRGGPDPLLDVAYEGGELEGGEVAAMERRHAEVVGELGAVGIDEGAWSGWLKFHGMQFFGSARSGGR